MRPLLFLLLASLAPALAADKTLDFYWIDSEGGGSTLIVTPAGESVLVDTGNPGPRDSARIHRVATEVAGLKQLDHVVITHFHGDHFGGLADLVKLMPVGTLWDKGVPDTSPDPGGSANALRWTLLSRPYRDAKVGKREVIAAGKTLPLKQTEGAPALEILCLGANQSFIAAPANAPRNPLTGTVPAKPVDATDNANSVVLRLRFGDFVFFDGGDLSWNVEDKLVCPHNLVGTVDLYQVNHHGLDVSNNPVLIHSLAPTVSVMNNGPRKGTSQSAMEALRSTPELKAMFQVHENVREDVANNCPKNCIANHGDHGEACQAHYLHARVAADSKTYLVEVPSQQHQQTFETRAKP